MKTYLYVIWQVFLRIFLVPILCGLGGYSFCGRFVGPFLIALGIDVLTGQAFNMVMADRQRKRDAELEGRYLEFQKNQTLQVPCAYCGAKNVVPLNLAVGSFACQSCKGENRLFLNFRTARITTQIDSPIMRAEPNPETNITVEAL